MASNFWGTESCPGYTTASLQSYQCWSTENHDTRPDVFELEDGRLVKITPGTDAQKGSFFVDTREKHGNRLMSVGSMTLVTESFTRHFRVTPAMQIALRSKDCIPGSYILIPKEVAATLGNRDCHPLLLPPGKQDGTPYSRRQAALRLIAESDLVSIFGETLHNFVAQWEGFRVSKTWRVKGLCPYVGEDARKYSRPGPRTLSTIGQDQFFLATKKFPDGSKETFRVRVFRTWDGINHAWAHPMLTVRQPTKTTVPLSVYNFCLSRCQ